MKSGVSYSIEIDLSDEMKDILKSTNEFKIIDRYKINNFKKIVSRNKALIIGEIINFFEYCAETYDEIGPQDFSEKNIFKIENNNFLLTKHYGVFGKTETFISVKLIAHECIFLGE